METPFPITTYHGEYQKEWTKTWTNVGDAWQFFDTKHEIVLDQDVYQWHGEFGFYTEYSQFLTLSGPDNDWGAFKLVGLMQIDKGCNLKKVCGQVTTRENDVRSFVAKGKVVERYRKSLRVKNYGPPDVYCIPVKVHQHKINLILIIVNNNRFEVYFLKGKADVGKRSQVPGMEDFYFWENISKVFTNIAKVLEDGFKFCGL